MAGHTLNYEASIENSNLFTQYILDNDIFNKQDNVPIVQRFEHEFGGLIWNILFNPDTGRDFASTICGKHLEELEWSWDITCMVHIDEYPEPVTIGKCWLYFDLETNAPVFMDVGMVEIYSFLFDDTSGGIPILK